MKIKAVSVTLLFVGLISANAENHPTVHGNEIVAAGGTQHLSIQWLIYKIKSDVAIPAKK
jgi:hypothetical protein